MNLCDTGKNGFGVDEFHHFIMSGSKTKNDILKTTNKLDFRIVLETIATGSWSEENNATTF